MRKLCLLALAWFAFGSGLLFLDSPVGHALEKQPSGVYRARRVALAAGLHGGVAILFAAEEPALDFMPYRQDSDFYYLT
jgi:Xaa-Pro aminopeptidase